MLLLYRMLLKDEGLAGLVIEHFKTIEFIPCLEVVNMLSHIARLKLSYYPKLSQAGVLAFLKGKLESEDEAVLEKALNLLGNLCKHSTFFFNYL
jgi:fused-like protein